MELLYKNEYGACYRMFDAPNPVCQYQLVVDTVGLFMSDTDMVYLLKIVRGSHKTCPCEDCKGEACNKIWCTNPLIDICLKVDEPVLNELEDLIQGARFMMHMDATLDKEGVRKKPKN